MHSSAGLVVGSLAFAFVACAAAPKPGASSPSVESSPDPSCARYEDVTTVPPNSRFELPPNSQAFLIDERHCLRYRLTDLSRASVVGNEGPPPPKHDAPSGWPTVTLDDDELEPGTETPIDDGSCRLRFVRRTREHADFELVCP